MLGRHARIPLLLAGALIVVAACSQGERATSPGDAVAPTPATPTTADAPFVRVLGTAQDGGLPHVGCLGEHCVRARREPAFRRLVASLAVVVPGEAGGPPRVHLVDATPDLPEQLDLLADVRRPPPGRVDRAPVDGVLLTHAHVGHYLGLALFGYEAVATRDLPLWATPRMLAFLADNGPWSELVRRGHVEPRPLAPGEEVDLGAGVRVAAVAAPHRDELSDTVGFRIAGPRRTLLYVPDTDAWSDWGGEALARAFAGVDAAWVDGTFFSLDELPGRSVEEIGHPLIRATMERFGERVAAGGLDLRFTHLNHSNPAVDPASAARREIEERGFAVLEEGEELEL